MTADDLNAPLGQQLRKRRLSIPITTSQVMAGVLTLFLGVFVVWAVVGNNPFGGEPIVVVPINLHPGPAAKTAEGQGPPKVVAVNPDAAAAVPAAPGQAAAPQAATKTITIIDGKTGERKEVAIPAPANDAAPAPDAGTLDQKFLEMSAHGAIPKIAADGVRPADAFAQPAKALPGKPDAPRIAIIVSGLGVSDSATADAIAKLPGAVTLGFMPYGSDLAALAGRARARGHEVLLQVPMEPFDYPDNDPGPQTLLTSLTPQQNLDRLYWLMSRFQGYVGIVGAMGGRFTASDQSFAPVLRETAKRGLIFVDDGANPRSLAGRIAGANNLPFAKADVTIDAVPTAGEIDHALGRLEMAARERGIAVGLSSGLPVAIDHIAKWAKTLADHGVQLVPITAVALKPKQT
ncbi:MAG TPA: divergent polysaccharide deacetylase family protein [Stellaceae bacterium]|nr:divergent polysaccharide deacetylase family protein [Stellaceae bacterium]